MMFSSSPFPCCREAESGPAGPGPVVHGLFFALLAALPVAAWPQRILFEKESQYHYIFVDENVDGIRTMHFRRKGRDYNESQFDTRNPNRAVLNYTRLFFSAFLLCPNASKVLMIGLGGASVPRLVKQFFPKVQMDCVELDPVVVEAATNYFDYRPNKKDNRVFIRDGRVQLRIFKARKQKYDLIMLDAFRGGYIPFHLTTKEFMELVKDLLTSRGVVAANMRPDFKIYDYHKRTLAAVFPSLYTFGKPGSNKICVALPHRVDVITDQMRRTALQLQARHPFTFRLSELVDDYDPQTDYETKGEIFTDDYAPANVLRGIPRE